ncbi:fibrobacter succinogenes major paralogous domain-containing protein [Ferruginibacter paludis]|uniref:fibrobacter succinogenes major paralogous domain-containing protein n=1 Tax=Ferruginibacter paludis TaxID=1310417 RepID=UPI0025B5C326|nr:fibrobacter succinogenes major paralogous domain-containing protein [Ferruginibacter paludis]MDN3657460.1 fibrobacter succinogenes major paralogous domain-containing protein [Ferruginibacter paludis]
MRQKQKTGIGRLLFFIVALFAALSAIAQVGIGTGTPAVSAQLDVSSTNKGFLPPRLTFYQRNSIQHPEPGLIIWCTDCHSLQVYDGTAWKNINITTATEIVNVPDAKICDQVWMGKNLDVNTYRNGDLIPQVTDSIAWRKLTTGAWCWYNNDSATYGGIYGRIYNWYAVNDSRGLAPIGWHIPSDGEWATLTVCVGGDSVAGIKLKSTIGWEPANYVATNSSGFTALPGGERDSITRKFLYIGQIGTWWTSTVYNATHAYGRFLRYNGDYIARNYFLKAAGFYVRCVKD